MYKLHTVMVSMFILKTYGGQAVKDSLHSYLYKSLQEFLKAFFMFFIWYQKPFVFRGSLAINSALFLSLFYTLFYGFHSRHIRDMFEIHSKNTSVLSCNFSNGN